MIACLSVKTFLRPWVSVFPVFLGLLLLSGCDDGYPQDLVYPQRTDPLAVKTAEKDAAEYDRPGDFPNVLFAGLTQQERAKLLLYPSKLEDEQRQQLDQALTTIFGSPAHPKVEVGGEIADSLKKMSQDLKLAEDLLAKLDPDTLTQGSVLYRHHCLHCHGLTGDGRGPTAPWVNPHPRDYRQGTFKFTSSKQSEGERKPRRADLLRTLREGIEGTSMPSFRLLPDNDLEALASYVIHLSLRGETEFQVMKATLTEGVLEGSVLSAVNEYLALVATRWQDAQAPGNQIQAEPSPNVSSEQEMRESVRRGFDLFVRAKPEGNKKSAGCLGCHTDFGRQSAYKYDYWGTIVRPTDLTTGIYRGGRRPIDLYWRIHSGVNGVTMPASKDNLDPKDIWDLVNFLRILPYPRMRANYEISLESNEPTRVAVRP